MLSKETLEESLDKLREHVRESDKRSESLRKVIDERFSIVEQEIAVIGKLVVQQAQDDEELPKRMTVTHLWTCDECTTKLGIYSLDYGSIRIRHRGAVTLITPGVGGVVQQLCYKCGHINEITDERPSDVQGPKVAAG